MLYYVVYLITNNTNHEIENQDKYVCEEIDKVLIDNYSKEMTDVPEKIFNNILKDLNFEYLNISDSIDSYGSENEIVKLTINISEAVSKKSIAEMRSFLSLDKRLSQLLEEVTIKPQEPAEDEYLDFDEENRKFEPRQPNKLIIVTTDKIKKDIMALMKTKKLTKEVRFSNDFKTSASNIVYEYFKLTSI